MLFRISQRRSLFAAKHRRGTPDEMFLIVGVCAYSRVLFPIKQRWLTKNIETITCQPILYESLKFSPFRRCLCRTEDAKPKRRTCPHFAGHLVTLDLMSVCWAQESDRNGIIRPYFGNIYAQKLLMKTNFDKRNRSLSLHQTFSAVSYADADWL